MSIPWVVKTVYRWVAIYRMAPEVGLTPEFIAVAQRDPLGANLDRIQMIKGWVDAEGRVMNDF